MYPMRRRSIVVPAVVAATGATTLAYQASSFVQSPSAANSAAAQSTGLRGASSVHVDAARNQGAARTACPAIAFGAVAVGAAARRRGPRVSRGDGGGLGDLAEEIPFEIRGFSLSGLILGAGVICIVLTLVDYITTMNNGGGTGLGSLLLIYAIPIFLLGAALTYAELQPVEVEVLPEAEGLFESKGTPTLVQIKKDVTRHRYGDDAHLDSSLKALGLIQKGVYPELFQIIEGKTDGGELEFTMLFKSKQLPYNTWSDPMKIKAFDRFFGPGVWASVYKYSKGEKIAALRLTTGKRPEGLEGDLQIAIDARLAAEAEQEMETA